MTTTLSSKGQIVLPKAIRTAHRWRPGTEFVIEENSDGILLRAVRRAPDTSVTLDQVIGCTGYTGPARTTTEMDAGVAREARRVWAAHGRRRTRT